MHTSYTKETYTGEHIVQGDVTRIYIPMVLFITFIISHVQVLGSHSPSRICGP